MWERDRLQTKHFNTWKQCENAFAFAWRRTFIVEKMMMQDDLKWQFLLNKAYHIANLFQIVFRRVGKEGHVNFENVPQLSQFVSR